MKNTILFWIIVFAAAIALNSCGTRKTETNKKEEVKKTDLVMNTEESEKANLGIIEESNTKKAVNTKIDKTDNSESEELNVRPIDNSKPAIYTDPSGKKHVLENAAMSTKKLKTKSETKTNKTDNSEEFRKAELKYQNEQKAILGAKLKDEADLKEKNKKVEKEFSYWNYLLLLIPIGLMAVAWFVYKKLNPIS